MAGKKGRSGANKRVIFSMVFRVSLYPQHRDLLPFFEQIAPLSAERRNEALFAAVRGGQSAARQEMERTESHRASHVLDTLLGDLSE
jgi:hypothetical protein